MSLICPKCQGEWRQYERNGVTIDQCSDCRGIFLDRGELDHLIDAENAWHEAPATPDSAPQPPAGVGAPSGPGSPPPAHSGPPGAPPPAPPGPGAPPPPPGYPSSGAPPGHGYPPPPPPGYPAYGQPPGYPAPYPKKRKKSFLDELFD